MSQIHWDIERGHRRVKCRPENITVITRQAIIQGAASCDCVKFCMCTVGYNSDLFLGR